MLNTTAQEMEEVTVRRAVSNFLERASDRLNRWSHGGFYFIVCFFSFLYFVLFVLSSRYLLNTAFQFQIYVICEDGIDAFLRLRKFPWFKRNINSVVFGYLFCGIKKIHVHIKLKHLKNQSKKWNMGKTKKAWFSLILCDAYLLNAQEPFWPF